MVRDARLIRSMFEYNLVILARCILDTYHLLTWYWPQEKINLQLRKVFWEHYKVRGSEIMSWAGPVWHCCWGTSLSPGEKIWSVSVCWPHILVSPAIIHYPHKPRTWQQSRENTTENSHLSCSWHQSREWKWIRRLHLSLLSCPWISMRSVTPKHTGIKRYKIHMRETFSFLLNFTSNLKLLFKWMKFGIDIYSEHFELSALPRSRLKQIVSYCIFLLGFVIWCVKRNIIQNVPCATITHHWPYITGQRKSYYPVTKIMFLYHNSEVGSLET